MKAKPRHIEIVLAGLLLAGTAAAVLGNDDLRESNSARARPQGEPVPAVHFAPLNVELPVSSVVFPAGKGSEIANAYCLMCHSAGMVLRQPALTVDEWQTEIRKMQSAFGAPIPADQVDALARYLEGINGRKSDSKPSTVDSQGS
jgi:mono/diheme cytochrome c family protein